MRGVRITLNRFGKPVSAALSYNFHTMTENPVKVVDISELNKATANELLQAAMDQGFLMVEGHDFSQKEVDALFSLSKDFFQLSPEEKNSFPISQDNCGYTGFGVENLDEANPDKKTGDPKEGFNFAQLNLADGTTTQPLPEILSADENQKLVSQSIVKLRETLSQILKLLALGLEIDEKDGGVRWFDMRHSSNKPSGSALRFLHYPSPKGFEPQESIRAGAHTDYGGVTLLFQQENQGGLEILSPISKSWEKVPFVPASESFKARGSGPPIVVNIADQLSFWTNGVLKSTVHRVKFPEHVQATGQSRYSIVFFSHPDDDTRLEPVPSKVVNDVKGRGAGYLLEMHGYSITAKEHLEKRLASTYGWSY